MAHALGTERFLREITLTARLDHPHILPLLDSGEANGMLYYVMPYVEGESLRERLTREKHVPVDEALEMAREVADALGYAHSRGIVHRDVKPENILLAGGHARVADFGIAQAVAEAGGDRLTGTGLIVGTPAYMSPEQAAGEEVDGRTDLYALGCVLYEALAGEPPYTGATAQAILAQHLVDAVPSVRRMRDRVPEHVEAAIARSLAKLKADRFGTARQFADSLVVPAADPLVRPGGRSPDREAPARIRRRGGVALAAVIVLLLLIGLDVGGLRQAVARWVGAAGSTAADEVRSVAVLPFQNVGGDAADEYFSDGLTEELIAALSQVRSLRVAARTSAFAFKGNTSDVREIGRTLNVGTVLMGSVRKAGERVRVTAQLIDASSGLGIWSETYDERALSDIFDIQADMALRIARALEANLTLSERGRLARKPTENLGAYTLYLKGRFAFSQRGEGLFTAIQYFQQAIAVDSQYARAHAGLASVYGPLGVLGYIHPREGRKRMGEAARRAVALDDGLSEAHTVLAAYLYVYEWNWAAAEREYRLAIDLDPNYPTAHYWYGFLLYGMGRFDESIAAGRRTQDLDPLSPDVSIAGVLMAAGSYDLARAELEKDIGRHPNYWPSHEGLGELLEATGEMGEAVSAFETAVTFAGRTMRPKAGLARVLALAGRKTEARRLVQELRSEAAESGIYHPVVAAALLAVEDTDAAMDWLEAAFRQRHPALVAINVDRRFGALRSDPRFQDLLRRIGFPL